MGVFNRQALIYIHESFQSIILTFSIKPFQNQGNPPFKHLAEAPIGCLDENLLPQKHLATATRFVPWKRLFITRIYSSSRWPPPLTSTAPPATSPRPRSHPDPPSAANLPPRTTSRRTSAS